MDSRDGSRRYGEASAVPPALDRTETRGISIKSLHINVLNHIYQGFCLF